ncbi:MAG: hypothetical protein GX139_12720 [Armatimonadetes bacterium]|jgi:uncharacterized protein YkwD|nr:hypothetical protein [Armatimonadota bacterium]
MAKISLYLVTLLLGNRLPGPVSAPLPQPVPMVISAQLNYEEQRLMDLANTERISQGLQPLRVNQTLVRVARAHSREMYEKSYFDHYSPTPGFRTPKDRYLRELGRIPAWACIGENLFYSSVNDPDLGNRCLMDSPAHAQNILGRQFEQIGVGVFEAPDGRFWVTQMFLSQMD